MKQDGREAANLKRAFVTLRDRAQRSLTALRQAAPMSRRSTRRHQRTPLASKSSLEEVSMSAQRSRVADVAQAVKAVVLVAVVAAVVRALWVARR